MVKTIKVKLLFWFLVLSVVPLLALTYYSTMTFQENLTREAKERALTLTASTASAIEIWLEEKIGRLEKLVQLEEIKTLNPEVIVPILKTLLQSDPTLDDIFFANENGDTFSAINPSINVSERAYFKNAMATGKPQVSNMLISKMDGKKYVMIACPVLVDGNPGVS